MNNRDLIALIDRLRALPTETEWLEFKRNSAEPQEIGEYLDRNQGSRPEPKSIAVRPWPGGQPP